MVTEKDVERLAGLSRIALQSGERSALVSDLEKVLRHFEDLQTISPGELEGLAGIFKDGKISNAMREDDSSVFVQALREKLIAAFPDRDGDYARVPYVFE